MATPIESVEQPLEPISGVHRIAFPSDMLMTALHDLTSPLSVLKLGVEQLGGPDDLGPEQRELAVGRLSRSIERMGELLGGLMTALELHEGDLPVRYELLDLGEIVEEVMHSLEPRAQRLDCRLAVRGREPVAGYWDSLRLWQIVYNLVSNALQHGKGGLVTARTWRQGEYAFLSVEDDGAGLAPWEQARVFERNWRGPRASGSVGHGLGLWIVRRLASALGGDVTLESEPGRGARFIVRLPSRGA